MNTKFEELCELYTNSKCKNLYASDESEIIKYNEKEYGDYLFFITLIRSNGHYLIFVNADIKDKLVFQGLLYESKEDLTNKYELLLYNLNLLSHVDFISKYYKKLKENL